MQLKVFEYENEQEIRTIEIDGEIWWVASDICKVLGLSNSREAISNLDDDEKDDVSIADTIGRKQKMNIINEPGLYRLIFKSIKPEAKKFKRWILHEVIPQIRKTGAYSIRGSVIPAFIKRFNENWDRVDFGYFSVIGELAIRIYGRLEQIGYRMPDIGATGQEMRPDTSVGKLFPKWLEKKAPEKKDKFKAYLHKLSDGQEVPARQYENAVLADFIEYVDTVWLRERAYGYFNERDKKALDYLPKLIPDLKTPKGKSTAKRTRF